MHREIDRLPAMGWISMFFNYQLLKPCCRAYIKTI
jgi:hypothetical protein